MNKIFKVILIILLGGVAGALIRIASYQCWQGDTVICYEQNLPNWGWVVYIIGGILMAFGMANIFRIISEIYKKTFSSTSKFIERNPISYCPVCGIVDKPSKDRCTKCGVNTVRAILEKGVGK